MSSTSTPCANLRMTGSRLALSGPCMSWAILTARSCSAPANAKPLELGLAQERCEQLERWRELCHELARCPEPERALKLAGRVWRFVNCNVMLASSVRSSKCASALCRRQRPRHGAHPCDELMNDRVLPQA